MVKNLPANAGNLGSTPGSGRSPGKGNGNPLQYSCLGNPWTEEPDGIQPMGLQRIGHNLVTKQQELNKQSRISHSQSTGWGSESRF